MNSPKRQAGGALRPDDPTYVVRRADTEIFDAIVAGDFTYVLTSRQMGKSSLVARLKKQLQQRDWLVSVVDLSLIGSTRGVTEEHWYYGLAYRIAQDLNIVQLFKGWWADHTQLTRAQTFSDFIRGFVLGGHSNKIALFFDEIDSTLPLEFTDDFFAVVRAVFNARATDEQYSRITITLLGVATPDQLIQDKRRTPFNIGYKVELDDFTLQQVIDGPGKDLNSEQVKQVYHWTNGHPYLTQRLLNELESGESVNTVDTAVENIFLKPTHGNEDSNLELTGARLTSADGNLSPHQREVLRVYKKLLKGKIVTEQPQSTNHNELKLSGIARVNEQGHLTIHNRIYQQAFDRSWINSVTSGDKQLKQVRYQAMSATAALALITFVSWYLYFYPEQLIREINLITEDRVAAESIAEKLLRFPWKEDDANKSLAEFWERKALAADYDDAGIIHLLEAYKLDATVYRKARLANNLNDVVKLEKTLVTTMRHDGRVQSVAFSADAKHVVTGSADNTARVWDARTGEPVTEPLRHDGRVQSVAFSADAKHVVTGSMDNTVRVWDARTGESVTELLHDGSVQSVAFSADAKHVVTGSDDNTARIWDVRTGESVTEPLRHDGSVYSVAFSADSKHVVTGSDDNTARVWDARTGESITELRHDDLLNSVAFSADGKHVVTGSDDNSARVWDARTGESVTKPLRHDGSVYSVAFSADAKHVVTGSWDHTARVWDARTGMSVTEPIKHNMAVYYVTFSADGKHVVTGSLDNTVRVWDARTGEPVTEPLRHHDLVFSLAISADGHYVVIGTWDNTARVWDTRTGEPVTDYVVNSVAFSADAKHVVTGSDDNTARIRDARTGESVTELLHDGSVQSVAFSADAKHVVTGSMDNTARIWDVRTGESVTEPLRHDGSVYSVAFSADGKHVVTGSDDKTARVWDVRTGMSVTEPLHHDSAVMSVAISTDGEHVVTGSDDKTARVWDVSTGEPVTEPLKHNSTVRSVAFSTDAQYVVTGSWDKTARIWDARTGDAITEPLRHDEAVGSVAFSTDAKHVVTGSWDNTARVWDAHSGVPVTEPLRHDDSVQSVAFSADGLYILTVSSDVAREWSIDTGKLVGEFKSGVGVSLVDAEYVNNGRSIAIGSEWSVSYIQNESNSQAVLPEQFSPNQLSALSKQESFRDHLISFSPLVDVSELNIDDTDELRKSLMTKFVFDEDETGTLYYPHEVLDAPVDGIEDTRRGTR